MRVRFLSLLALAGLVLSRPAAGSTDAPNGSSRWIVEQMPGGSVTFRDGSLEIEDAAGCSVWYREKLTAPVAISYTVTVVSSGGKHDRVSDVNCFFLATDPHAPDGAPFAPGHGRSGKFEDYDSLRTYYVGLGGNANTTTRFRRYAGDGSKPLLPEHDLSSPGALLAPNRTYRIAITVGAEGDVTYRRDGQVLFAWRDPSPLGSGWFALRTVQSHLVVREFSVRPLR